jgi:hypothetical protein
VVAGVDKGVAEIVGDVKAVELGHQRVGQPLISQAGVHPDNVAAADLGHFTPLQHCARGGEQPLAGVGVIAGGRCGGPFFLPRRQALSARRLDLLQERDGVVAAGGGMGVEGGEPGGEIGES